MIGIIFWYIFWNETFFLIESYGVLKLDVFKIWKMTFLLAPPKDGFALQWVWEKYNQS
jgi:hypothetical protein